MRGPFWPAQAWNVLISGAWPWIDPSETAAFQDRLRSVLEPYWKQRLAAVPTTVLPVSVRESFVEVEHGSASDLPVPGGFEKIGEAMMGLPDSFWFFDLGCAAWILRLGELRVHGALDGDSPGRFREVEEIWAQKGPAAAREAVEAWMGDTPGAHPGLCLYHVPLALWQARDAEAALVSLDRGISGLSSRGQAMLGETLPITYGILLALTGDLDAACDLMRDTEISDDFASWRGFDSPEVRYHRARYLWGTGDTSAARDLLLKVVGQSPTYLLRLMSDASMLDSDGRRDGTLIASIGGLVEQSRNAVIHWQHVRPEREATPESDRRARALVDALRRFGSEPYVILSVAAGVRDLQAGVEMLSPSFRHDYAAMQNLVADLPHALPLNLGPSFARRLVGEEGSDIDQLTSLVNSGRASEAQRLLARMSNILPLAAKMATISYASRLVRALATAADTVEQSDAPEDRVRLIQLHRLWEGCIELATPIREIPEEMGPALTHALKRVWTSIGRIEEAWVQSEGRAFGRMQIHVADGEETVLRRGDFRALHLEVRDASGRPVHGAPVLWRVLSGPAMPKDPSENLDVEWASSLQTGRVVIPLTVRGLGREGEVEARLLGSSQGVRVSYRVEG